MNGARRSLLLALIQIALVLSLGGKLLYDRMTRPRVWVAAEVFDPELPIRGRYLSERLRIPAEGFGYAEVGKKNPNQWFANSFANRQWGYLEVRDGQLIAKSQGSGAGAWMYLSKNPDGTISGLTEEPVLFFVSEHADMPHLKAGEQIWVEVTLPAKGPPRPIRIGVKKNGVLTPLPLR